MNKKSKKFALAALALAVTIPAVTIPASAHQNATPEHVVTSIAQALPDFKDVPKKHSAYIEIMKMREQGIISGYPDNTFKPAASISRVHVAALFMRSLDLKPIRNGKEFTDVPKSHPYHAIVQAVYKAGIFDGDIDGTFGVNDNLTRAQMAKVLDKAFKLKPATNQQVFSDVPSTHWANPHIATLHAHGITVGDNGKYKPGEYVSRAHYAVFLYRALNPDKAPVPEKPVNPKPEVKPDPKPEVKPDPKPEVKPDPKPEDLAPGVKPTPPAPPAPPEVKPNVPDEKPKPEVKPDPKPEVKPDPKPEVKPEVKPPSGTNPFPKLEDVRVPKGWVDKTNEYRKTIENTVFKNSPKKGSTFGISNSILSDYNNPAHASLMQTELSSTGSKLSVNEWYAIVNNAIKTGELYIAPDYTFGVFVRYYVDKETNLVHPIIFFGR